MWKYNNIFHLGLSFSEQIAKIISFSINVYAFLSVLRCNLGI